MENDSELQALTEMLDKSDKSSDTETIKDGTSFYRILPALKQGELPYAFHGVHWCFSDDQGRQIPVRCSYDKEKYCPKCEEVFPVQDLVAKNTGKDKAALRATGEGLSDEEIKDLENWLFKNKADKAHYLNAVTADGQVKKLKLKPSYITGMRGAKSGELKKKFQEAVGEKKFNPFSLETGCWFKFTRSGQKFGTTYGVDFKRTTRKDGNQIIDTLDTTPLSVLFPDLYEAIKAQLASGGQGPLFDIHNLFKVYTSSEIKRFMNGEPVPSQRRSNETQTLAVGSLEPLPTVAEVATDAPAQTPEVVAAIPAAAAEVTPAPAPVAAAPIATPVTPAAPVATPTVSDKVAQEKERLKKLGILK